MRVENTGNPQSRCCPFHTCRVANCFGQVADGSLLCRHHGCDMPGCNGETTPDRAYCFVHRCRDNNCQLPAKGDNGYCAPRACTRNGCGAVRADLARALCAAHLFDAAREEGFVAGEAAGDVAHERNLREQLMEFEMMHNDMLDEQERIRAEQMPRAPTPPPLPQAAGGVAHELNLQEQLMEIQIMQNDLLDELERIRAEQMPRAPTPPPLPQVGRQGYQPQARGNPDIGYVMPHDWNGGYPRMHYRG
ncbi:hypothetical protein BGZ63DRAFT_450282 [Mariannaea sp. PMI_226]|nr:hypothetical protein BGZ63DRAFT_450282 [Mariannaea sp. PMI_226]